MHTNHNYQTKKELRRDFQAGKTIEVHQPGPWPLKDGPGCIEGPHEYHRWYVNVVIKDNIVTEIKG